MMIGAAIIAVAALVGASLHRFRGGGFQFVPRFGLGRSLWLVAPIVGLIAWPFVDALSAFYLATLYLIGSVQGWGSYFDCGNKATGYQDDAEVKWIDRTLYKLYGEETADSTFKWRQKRDCTGMALRGVLYLPMMLVIPTAFGSWLALIPGLVAVALFAPAYRIGWMTKWNTGAAEYIVGGVFGAALSMQYIIGA